MYAVSAYHVMWWYCIQRYPLVHCIAARHAMICDTIMCWCKLCYDVVCDAVPLCYNTASYGDTIYALALCCKRRYVIMCCMAACGDMWCCVRCNDMRWDDVLLHAIQLCDMLWNTIVYLCDVCVRCMTDGCVAYLVCLWCMYCVYDVCVGVCCVLWNACAILRTTYDMIFYVLRCCIVIFGAMRCIYMRLCCTVWHCIAFTAEMYYYMSWNGAQCYVKLCYAMTCCAAKCCTMLCDFVGCYALSCDAMLCCTIACYIMRVCVCAIVCILPPAVFKQTQSSPSCNHKVGKHWSVSFHVHIVSISGQLIVTIGFYIVTINYDAIIRSQTKIHWRLTNL